MIALKKNRPKVYVGRKCPYVAATYGSAQSLFSRVENFFFSNSISTRSNFSLFLYTVCIVSFFFYILCV